MNKEFRKQMIKLTKFLEKFYTKHMKIDVYCSEDFHDFARNIKREFIACLKKDYPIVFLRLRKFNAEADLNIEIACHQSTVNSIEIIKNQMLSHRILKINLFCRDYEEFNNAYFEIFVPWAKKFKEPSDGKTLEFTWLVPPDDPTDPNYKTYMKQFLKVCEENKEFFTQRELKK